MYMLLLLLILLNIFINFLLIWATNLFISYILIFIVQLLTYFSNVDSIQQHFVLVTRLFGYWMLSLTFLIYMFTVKEPSLSHLSCSPTSVLVTWRFSVINTQPTKTMVRFIFQSTAMFFSCLSYQPREDLWALRQVVAMCDEEESLSPGHLMLNCLRPACSAKVKRFISWQQHPLPTG